VRWLAICLAAGCSFSAPPLPGAREACEDYYAAWRARAIECGQDAAAVDATFSAYVRDRCSDVVWSDARQIYEECIPAQQAVACDALGSVKCGGYVRL